MAHQAPEKLVIIGNGMAPGRMLEELFEKAPDRYEVTIFNAEPRVNYDRIMLSPVLSGEKAYADIVIHDDAWYAANGVTLHKGAKVAEIDRASRTVTAENGITATYDKLVIATGSSPFIIPVPGHQLPGVLAYRDLDDVEKMLAGSRDGGRAIVIGAGLLGLEAAYGLKRQGMDVTVIHLMPTIMERQLDPAAAYLLEKALTERGIEIVTKANTKRILGETKVEGIELEDGRIIEGSMVVMAVGIRPASNLAKEAGIAVNRGIVVDDGMMTSDAAVYALGECAEHRGTCYGLVAPLYESAGACGSARRRRGGISWLGHQYEAEGHRHQSLLRRRLCRWRGARGNRAARRDRRRLQASRAEGKPYHRCRPLRRDIGRVLVLRSDEEGR